MAEDNTGEAPKIQIDSDWKAQAQREKERLKQQEQQRKPAPGTAPGTAPGAAPGAAGGAATGGTGQAPRDPRAPQAKSATPAAGGADEADIPPASFEALVSTLVSQALFAMGAMPDPRTGQRVAYLDLARQQIDLLGVLEEKTKGNLNEEEDTMLSQVLYELRNQYVYLVSSTRQQQTGGGGAGAAPRGGGAGAGGTGPVLVT